MDIAITIASITLGIVGYLLLTALRAVFWPRNPVPVTKYNPRHVGDITLEELSKCNGEDPCRPILFAVRGSVYDVSAGRDFYGPGGGYHVFAGRECSRALGKMIVSEEECNCVLDDLTEKELATLQGWEEKFAAKYKIVGHVVAPKLLSLKELALYDGSDASRPIYLAVRGVIFDVSAGKDFYGVDGAYPFGGKECARALAKFSTDTADHDFRRMTMPGGSRFPSKYSHRRFAQSCRVSASQAPPVSVRFRLQRTVDYGEKHCIVGNHRILGKWDIGRGADMTWGNADEWISEVPLQPGTALEFKIVQVGPNGVNWEDGENHLLSVPADANVVDVLVTWGQGLQVTVGGAIKSPNGVDTSLPQEMGNADYGTPAASSSVDGLGGSQDDDGYSSGYSSGSLYSDDERPPSQQWAGRSTVFMTSNTHSSDRTGVWNVEGLEGPALHLVAGDRDAGSWLKKLEVVKTLLVDSAPAMRPDLTSLSHAFVYLTWVATGALPCVESGGHRRPNHHAQLSRSTFRSLEWIAGERDGTADALLARRMHSRLPSFKESFTQSTPLTRIRDIAHRNDIPQSLKQEIKHTIQNKLHRNAGPEDLVATEAMLSKVTATPGEYPEAFVEELRTFLNELRDFFNAGSLTDALRALQPSLDEGSSQIADYFYAAKGKLDDADNNNNGASVDDNTIMDALHAATSVRALLAHGLSSGLRNDASDRAMAMRQRWRLAEIRAEDYVFVLLSRFINKVEDRGGARALAGGTDGSWGLPIGALVIGLRHLGLSGYESSECMALEHELTAWQKLGGFQQRDEALRLRATLLRLHRLTDGYCQLLLNAMTQPAVNLGLALGVEKERFEVFVESEIRSSVVFQVSKLVSIMLRATAVVADVTPWDVLVAGSSSGVLIEVKELTPGCLDAAAVGDQGAILVVDKATGDEEIGPLGPRLRGVILRHELPHLSHLGVRARQEKVPFVTCEDNELLKDTLSPFIGRVATIRAQPDGVTIAFHEGAAKAEPSTLESTNTSAPSLVMDVVDRVSDLQFVPLEDATASTCGAKAASCGRLLSIAMQCAAIAKERTGHNSDTEVAAVAPAPIFEAAHGIVLPFGCMEAAIKADKGKAQEILDAILSRADSVAAGLVSNVSNENEDESAPALVELDDLCAQAHAIISSVTIPQSFLQIIGACFDPDTTVIVRSSANVEDLKGMSGAGLYESVPNINPREDLKGMQSAITTVWASLFTRRALLARAAARVPSGSAAMAVVVQAQVAPELSFVLHTVHPLSRNPSILVAEVAPGLGETLASGTRGSGWRFEVEKEGGSITTNAFANFSQALMPVLNTGMGLNLPNEADGDVPPSAEVALKTMDYSTQEMSWSGDMRGTFGRRIAAIGRLLEAEFGEGQDVEGCVAQSRYFVVQTRPQP